MSPFWVVQRFRPRFWDLVPFAALQLDRRGYLVRVAEETTGSWENVRSLVVLAVRPRWRWWLELARAVSFRSQQRRSRFSRRSAGGPHGAL